MNIKTTTSAAGNKRLQAKQKAASSAPESDTPNAAKDTFEPQSGLRQGIKSVAGVASTIAFAPSSTISAVVTPSRDGYTERRGESGLTATTSLMMPVIAGTGGAIYAAATGSPLGASVASGAAVGSLFGAVYFGVTTIVNGMGHGNPFNDLMTTDHMNSLAATKQKTYKETGSVGATIAEGLKHNYKASYEFGGEVVDGTINLAVSTATGTVNFVKDSTSAIAHETGQFFKTLRS